MKLFFCFKNKKCHENFFKIELFVFFNAKIYVICFENKPIKKRFISNFKSYIVFFLQKKCFIDIYSAPKSIKINGSAFLFWAQKLAPK